MGIWVITSKRLIWAGVQVNKLSIIVTDPAYTHAGRSHVRWILSWIGFSAQLAIRKAQSSWDGKSENLHAIYVP
jgi:hypothetical protein